ncbi:macro domain-containing protein [Chryseobacterium herbae]|uniref:Macro domain-containing protein n=1 Tax=Chryseobacterium herbae TaxID=2976476 RepID=A0ABT2ISR4_9FLAO|nr:macro domain-containing protein [Chryseobacterium sp. pc1-10]MCT2561861.1 macro domain-containing protein [Chryseobacterium sp. pc1-10]
MEIIESGNIFESNAQTLVNTVNCVGVMGKGLALEFKKRYPEMFKKYQQLCNDRLLDIGKLWLYKGQHRWVLNFPTKYDWRQPSTAYYLEKGLDKFMETYRTRGIESIAFPLLGASNGGIPPEVSLKIMTDYLKECDIPVTIYFSYKPKIEELFSK